MNKGEFIFVKDEYYSLVNDPYLKLNYPDTKRPHYFLFEDNQHKGLLWAVPSSTRIAKYQAIIESKVQKGRPHDGIRILTIAGEKAVLLFQDMIPVIEKYIADIYIRAPLFTADRSTWNRKNSL